MNKRKLAVGIVSLFVIAAIGAWLYVPKSIQDALKHIDAPFEVGTVVTTQELDEDTTFVMYTNQKKDGELQNAVIRKNGLFYEVLALNGTLKLKFPKSGDRPKADALITPYGDGDSYVIIAVAYHKDVSDISCGNQMLCKLNCKGYRVFYGSGTVQALRSNRSRTQPFPAVIIQAESGCSQDGLQHRTSVWLEKERSQTYNESRKTNRNRTDKSYEKMGVAAAFEYQIIFEREVSIIRLQEDAKVREREER